MSSYLSVDEVYEENKVLQEKIARLESENRRLREKNRQLNQVIDARNEQDAVEIKASDNTLENCYDVILVNEDYTIGNILNYELYSVFYNDTKFLDYVGFKKLHPHDTDSILRISLVDKTKGIPAIKTMVISVIDEALKKFTDIRKLF